MHPSSLTTSSSARHMTRLRARSPRSGSDKTMLKGITMWGRARAANAQRQQRALEASMRRNEPERTLPLLIPTWFFEH